MKLLKSKLDERVGQDYLRWKAKNDWNEILIDSLTLLDVKINDITKKKDEHNSRTKWEKF